MVRIQDSQSWHRGSIPLSTTPPFVSGSRKVILTERLPFLFYTHRHRDTKNNIKFSESIFNKSDYGLSAETNSHVKHIATGSIGNAHCSVEMKTLGVNLIEFHV